MRFGNPVIFTFKEGETGKSYRGHDPGLHRGGACEFHSIINLLRVR